MTYLVFFSCRRVFLIFLYMYELPSIFSSHSDGFRKKMMSKIFLHLKGFEPELDNTLTNSSKVYLYILFYFILDLTNFN